MQFATKEENGDRKNGGTTIPETVRIQYSMLTKENQEKVIAEIARLKALQSCDL